MVNSDIPTTHSKREFLKFADLMEIAGVSRPTIYAWVEAGLLPKPIKLGRNVRWLKSDIDEWLVKQAAVNN